MTTPIKTPEQFHNACADVMDALARPSEGITREQGETKVVAAVPTGSTASPEYMKAWLKKHFEGFHGPRSGWSESTVDSYHTSLGLIYAYESEKPPNTPVSQPGEAQSRKESK